MSKYVQQGWYEEAFFRQQMKTGFKVKSVLHEEDSPYQTISVLDTEAHGKLLLLNGKTMICERYEAIYHEVISHVPAACLPTIKKVLVVGGGDGGVIREFAKHRDIEEIHLVEIDQKVIDVSKDFFPECAIGFDDPRVKIFCEDGVEFVRKNKNTYDIAVIDSTDPEDFAEGLFQEDFYRMVYEALTDKGVMTAQTENPLYDQYGIGDIYGNLRRVFPQVHSYWAPIPIYPGVFWTFAFCSKSYGPLDLNPERLKMMKKFEDKLFWYNHDWHRGAFSSSNFVKRIMNHES